MHFTCFSGVFTFSQFCEQITVIMLPHFCVSLKNIRRRGWFHLFWTFKHRKYWLWFYFPYYCRVNIYFPLENGISLRNKGGSCWCFTSPAIRQDLNLFEVWQVPLYTTTAMMIKISQVSCLQQRSFKFFLSIPNRMINKCQCCLLHNGEGGIEKPPLLEKNWMFLSPTLFKCSKHWVDVVPLTFVPFLWDSHHCNRS